jgi:hypothetical protein
MSRLVLAVSAIVVGVVVSSCAVGVRQPATEITDTSAVLNGKVLSTTGGPGSWYIEYGPTAARTEKTPTRTIDFVANESEPVSEPVDGLEPGAIYHFAVCAEDSDNPGDPFCSPDATFSTGDSVVGEARQCEGGVEPPCRFQGPFPLQDIWTVDAHSTASGDAPSGTLEAVYGYGGRGSSIYSVDVTCLHVVDNVAIIGGLGEHFGPFEDDHFPIAVVIRVTDGGGPRSRQDLFAFVDSERGDFEGPPLPPPTDCSSFVDEPPDPHPGVNQEGDLTVTDVQPVSPARHR